MSAFYIIKVTVNKEFGSFSFKNKLSILFVIKKYLFIKKITNRLRTIKNKLLSLSKSKKLGYFKKNKLVEYRILRVS